MSVTQAVTQLCCGATVISKATCSNAFAAMENIQGTFHDLCVSLRLKYSEDIFRKRVENLGTKVQAPVKLVGLSVDEDGFPWLPCGATGVIKFGGEEALPNVR